MATRYWDEDENEAGRERAVTSEGDIADLAFALSGGSIPADHAYALSRAIAQALPWFEGTPGAGMHLIHGAESGNGWYRPENEGAILYLARRARLTLRLPVDRLTDAERLTGAILDVSGCHLAVGTGIVQRLVPSDAVYARYVVDEHGEESPFLDQVGRVLDSFGVGRRKIMCGRIRRLALPDGELMTRSVLVAGLSPSDSLGVQQAGVGPNRLLGCGLFVPYKPPGPSLRYNNRY